MSEKYLIGIDNGGSEIKCAVFSLDGREVAVASRRLPIEVPHPGWSERDCLEVWDKNAEAIHEALELAGICGTDVAGIGLTGYGNGFCLVDGAGRPTYPAIVSTDERADAICDEFAETGVERAIYPMTCQSTWAAQPIALLAWFRRNKP
ncbi:MAG: carbohydrate kinase, partial [Olsenella sp.]|nr:carbohydrate kinase [Olsenella sp.]